MLDPRKAFALKFRSLAESFRGMAVAGLPAVDLRLFTTDQRVRAVKHGQLTDDAGPLVVEAYRRGLLVHPMLGAIIDKVIDHPAPRPEGAQSWPAPVPANVFCEVCGNHTITAIIEPDGTLRTVEARHGGMMPALQPELASGEADNPQNPAYQALVGDWLAEVVECDPKEARDQYAYQERMRGTVLQKIMDAINDTQGWEPIYSIQGVKKIVSSYAIRRDLPKPKPCKPGRPKKLN